MIYPVTVSPASTAGSQLFLSPGGIVALNFGYHAVLDMNPERATPPAVEGRGTPDNSLIVEISDKEYSPKTVLNDIR